MSRIIRPFTTLVTTSILALGVLLGGSPDAVASAPTSDAIETAQTLETETDSESERVAAAVELDGEININTASAEQLELLPGIGPSIASRIVSYRKSHPFKKRNQIMRVKGVGQKTFAKVKDYLVVEGETTLKVAGK